MTDLRKAAEMALEALDGLYLPGELIRVNKAIEALRQALAQQELADSIRPKGKSILNGLVDENETLKKCLFQMQEAAKNIAKDNQESTTYAGNGTAGIQNETKPTGFFFQMPSKQEPIAWLDPETHLTYSNLELKQHNFKEIDFIPLYAVLPKPIKQEPVALIAFIHPDHFNDVCDKANGNSSTPLYAGEQP